MTTTLHSYTDDNAHAVFGTREISSLNNMSEYLLHVLQATRLDGRAKVIRLNLRGRERAMEEKEKKQQEQKRRKRQQQK
jgi:hypothetical protein